MRLGSDFVFFIGQNAVSLQASTPFISHERPSRFIDVELHALVGGSTVTQNYSSCFPQISEMDLTLGTAVGAGARACILFSDFIGLGCEANILINNYKMSMAVANDDAMSMTTGFIHNHYYTACFPVFITLNFNLGPVVKWNIDGGMYYTYGLSGRSKTPLYSALLQFARNLHNLELPRRSGSTPLNRPDLRLTLYPRHTDSDRLQKYSPCLQCHRHA